MDDIERMIDRASSPYSPWWRVWAGSAAILSLCMFGRMRVK